MRFSEGFQEYRPSFPTEKFGRDKKEPFNPHTLSYIGRTRTDIAVVLLARFGDKELGHHVDVWEEVGRAGFDQQRITYFIAQLTPDQHRLLMATSPSNCL